MSIDPEFVELTADVLRIILHNASTACGIYVQRCTVP